MHVVGTKALFRGQGEASPLASKFSGANTLYQRTPHAFSYSTLFSICSGAAANSEATKSRKSPLACCFRVKREVFGLELLPVMGIHTFLYKYKYKLFSIVYYLLCFRAPLPFQKEHHSCNDSLPNLSIVM